MDENIINNGKIEGEESWRTDIHKFWFEHQTERLRLELTLMNEVRNIANNVISSVLIYTGFIFTQNITTIRKLFIASLFVLIFYYWIKKINTSIKVGFGVNAEQSSSLEFSRDYQNKMYFENEKKYWIEMLKAQKNYTDKNNLTFISLTKSKDFMLYLCLGYVIISSFLLILRSPLFSINLTQIIINF